MTEVTNVFGDDSCQDKDVMSADVNQCYATVFSWNGFQWEGRASISAALSPQHFVRLSYCVPPVLPFCLIIYPYLCLT